MEEKEDHGSFISGPLDRILNYGEFKRRRRESSNLGQASPPIPRGREEETRAVVWSVWLELDQRKVNKIYCLAPRKESEEETKRPRARKRRYYESCQSCLFGRTKTRRSSGDGGPSCGEMGSQG